MRLQSLIRCVLCSVSLLASINFAQAFPCTQSMIAGKWIFATIFRVASFTNPVGIACPIAIAPDGKTSTSGSCTAQPIPLLTSPSGKLLIDSSCKVTGPISWTSCDPTFCTKPTPSSPPPFNCGVHSMGPDCLDSPLRARLLGALFLTLKWAPLS
jgi:hypothetical protein